MNRKVWIIISVLVLLLVIFVIYRSGAKDGQIFMEVEAQRGKFEVLVAVTGELQAENSEAITAPTELRSRNLRFSSIRIQDLIPEGTVVMQGDYVALLDRSEADNRLKDIADNVEQRESQYLKTQLDTTMMMRNLRDELINLKFSLEEAQIRLEQSKFEPPATVRQAEIDLDKANRAYEQAKRNYNLRESQAKADMQQVSIDLSRARRQLQEMEGVLDKFRITAPSDGMVIYHREWGGQKRRVGSNINPWDLTVATLPDLSSMISRTYINEIDISRVKQGQQVRIGVDAFPENEYLGEVLEVANIGEQLPNTDAKVFEVLIKLHNSDPILRPAMTTSNAIIVADYEDVVYLPIEAIFSNDSLTYVYRKNGVKQIVLLGDANENEIIVRKGLSSGDKVLLNVPENPERYRYAGLEIKDEVIEAEKEKEIEDIPVPEESGKAGFRRESGERRHGSPNN